jgi:photosystem II stability/assembly factor-like uncharacterized protein
MRGERFFRSVLCFVLLVFFSAFVSGAIIAPSMGASSPTGWYIQSSSTDWYTTHILCVSAVDADNAWLGKEWGSIYRTSDGGNNWQKVSQFPDSKYGVHCYDIDALNGTSAWVVGWTQAEGAIARTDDGGVTWDVKYRTPDSPPLLDSWYKSISALDTQTAWVAGNSVDYNGNKGPSLIKTTDGGAHWTAVNTAIPQTDSVNDVELVDANTAWVTTSLGAVLKTIDGGATWERQSDGSGAFKVSACSSKCAWAACRNGTILHTSDGSTWTTQTSGAGSDLNGIIAVDDHTAWASAQNHKVLRTVDGGATWNAQYPWPGSMIEAVDAIDGNIAWAAGRHFDSSRSETLNMIYHTTDGGLGSENPRPYIWGMTKMSQVGGSVDITGTGFGAVQGSSYATCGSVRATDYESWGDTNIRFKVPPVDFPANVPVTVTTAYGTSNSTSLNVTWPPPTVSSVSPNSSTADQQLPLEITGNGFHAGASVSFEAGAGPNIPNASEVVVVSDTRITCKVTIPHWVSGYPYYPFVMFDVIVQNPNSFNGRLSGGLTVYPNAPACGLGALNVVGVFGIAMALMSAAGLYGRRRKRRRSI